MDRALPGQTEDRQFEVRGLVERHFRQESLFIFYFRQDLGDGTLSN